MGPTPRPGPHRRSTMVRAIAVERVMVWDCVPVCVCFFFFFVFLSRLILERPKEEERRLLYRAVISNDKRGLCVLFCKNEACLEKRMRYRVGRIMWWVNSVLFPSLRTYRLPGEARQVSNRFMHERQMNRTRAEFWPHTSCPLTAEQPALRSLNWPPDRFFFYVSNKDSSTLWNQHLKRPILQVWTVAPEILVQCRLCF
jgi:hypothetical protein